MIPLGLNELVPYVNELDPHGMTDGCQQAVSDLIKFGEEIFLW